jgi:tRNA nucleotidyltransferase (CCA-adding enzyme)
LRGVISQSMQWRVTSSGSILDPFDGRTDLLDGRLRCVGNAEDRMREDALRALRAIRFAVTKGFVWDLDLNLTMVSDWLPPLLASVSVERRREELLRCFQHDTPATLDMLCHKVPHRVPRMRCSLTASG